MPVQRSAYGPIVALNKCTGAAVTLDRVPLKTQSDVAGDDTEKKWFEDDLRNLLFDFPQALPIKDIDESYRDPVPICKELPTRDSGFIDALYMNRMGKLTLVEFKLWRNPEARRKVIGQILDYAKDLASWNYEDLQGRVSHVLKKSDNLEESDNILYKLVTDNSSGDPVVNESDFVNNVTRNLHRGEFLLLIVGDGIQETTSDIVNFVQKYSGLHFNLALVETALYQDGQDRWIVQPRVLARTEIIQRHTVTVDLLTDPPSIKVMEDESDSMIAQKKENLCFWKEVFDKFSFSVETEIPKLSDQENIAINDDLKYGFRFYASLRRSDTPAEMRCYLTHTKNNLSARDLLDSLVESIDELQENLGDDLKVWGRKKHFLGFAETAKFLEVKDYSEDDFKYAVNWMRKHLDRLVSELRPRLQQMMQDKS